MSDPERLAEIQKWMNSASALAVALSSPQILNDIDYLLAELDRTTADLAVAAEVARERGQEVEGP